MKKKIMGLAVLMSCAISHAALITVGDATGTDWSGTDLQTISSASGTSSFTLNDNNTSGVVQSFTATESMTVGTISILAQRLTAGMDFGVDVYHFPAGETAAYGPNPSKFRLSNATYSTLLKSYTLNASTGITSGVPGSNMFSIVLDEAEQFDIATGEGYGIHIYSKVSGGTGDRILIWNYADSSAYADGTYGVPDSNTVAARDLGVAITAIPEPASLSLVLFSGSLALIYRRIRM